jgi:hypothetical protein
MALRITNMRRSCAQAPAMLARRNTFATPPQFGYTQGAECASRVNMTIYWVNTESNDALDALAAIEHALATGETGTPPAAALPESERRDSYLDDNLAYLHDRWNVDQHAIVTSSRPVLARAVHLFQRAARRATWWHSLPQWQQVSAFHGALVRVVDVLFDRQRLLALRIAELERAHLPAHLYALEQQVQALRAEQRQLRRRIAELEGRLAASGDEARTP